VTKCGHVRDPLIPVSAGSTAAILALVPLLRLGYKSSPAQPLAERPFAAADNKTLHFVVERS
jgi:hypothetical protein